MFVKPNTGLSIRDPDLKDLLPPEGRDVPDSDYWHRRIRDLDVVLVVVGTVDSKKKANRSAEE